MLRGLFVKINNNSQSQVYDNIDVYYSVRDIQDLGKLRFYILSFIDKRMSVVSKLFSVWRGVGWHGRKLSRRHEDSLRLESDHQSTVAWS